MTRRTVEFGCAIVIIGLSAGVAGAATTLDVSGVVSGTGNTAAPLANSLFKMGAGTLSLTQASHVWLARSDPRAARGFCRSLRSHAAEKLLARGLRGRPRLVVFHLSLALAALIVGPTEALAAHGSMRR